MEAAAAPIISMRGTLSTYELDVGWQGSGSFTQTGGSNTIDDGAGGGLLSWATASAAAAPIT